jgi:hypothetical protein
MPLEDVDWNDMGDDVSKDEKPSFVPIVIGVLEIVKASLWPAAIIFIFSFLYSPLKEVLNKLPDVIGRADVITIGDLKLQLTKALQVEATPEVREALRSVTSAGASKIIRLSTAHLMCRFEHDTEKYDDERAVDDTLMGRNLVTVVNSPQDNDEKRKDCYLVELTDLGRQVQSFIIAFLASSLRLSST